jgi:hypothetical protein
LTRPSGFLGRVLCPFLQGSFGFVTSRTQNSGRAATSTQSTLICLSHQSSSTSLSLSHYVAPTSLSMHLQCFSLMFAINTLSLFLQSIMQIRETNLHSFTIQYILIILESQHKVR